MAVSQCPCLTLSNVMLDMPKSHWFLHYPSTHSTFNLIGPCNRHPNIQSHKDTYAQTTDIHGELNSNGQLNNSERTTSLSGSLPFLGKQIFCFDQIFENILQKLQKTLKKKDCRWVASSLSPTKERRKFFCKEQLLKRNITIRQ